MAGLFFFEEPEANRGNPAVGNFNRTKNGFPDNKD